MFLQQSVIGRQCTMPVTTVHTTGQALGIALTL